MTVIDPLIDLALSEDIGAQDITAQLLPADQQATAQLIVRESAIICGCEWVSRVFAKVDPSLMLDWPVKDGDAVTANQIIFSVTGSVRSILTAERVAINFLQTLSGTATLTHQFVDKLQDTNTTLLDTRKTIPGWRQAQKYAVRCGGGINHRMGLFDAFLIKENHIAACGSITKAVQTARELYPDKKLMLEVENLDELQQALSANVKHIMCDNFSLELLREAVTLTANQATLEASGNVTLKTIRDIALTGIDFISAGAITKNLQAIDFSLKLL